MSKRGGLEAVGTASSPSHLDYAAAEVEAAFEAATAEERKSAPPPRAHLYVEDGASGVTHALGLMPMAPPFVTMGMEMPTTDNPDVSALVPQPRQHVFGEDPNDLLSTIARSKAT